VLYFCLVNKSLLIQIIYSAASIQGLFLSFLLLRTKINQPANRILAILLIILSLHLILVGFDNRDFFIAFPHLSRVSWIIGSLYWPLIFSFVQHITQTQPDKFWKSFWLFLPFLVLLTIMMPYYIMSGEEKVALLSNFEEASKDDFGWINQVVSLLHILFQGYFLIYYLRIEKLWKDEYSEIESVRIQWLKHFLILTLAATTLAVFSFFARTWQIPVLSQLYSFHFIGIVFLFYWLSYKALTQPVLFGIVKDHQVINQLETTNSGATAKYKKSSLETEQLIAIFEKVKKVLSDQQLYRKNDLTLTQLSAAVDIPRHQLSQAINSCYAGNFFDLINDYRVEAFKHFASRSDKKHLSLLGIAQEAGFNSKASFYSVFKKKTGMTPAEYLENQSNAA
jgi:AraC-like DNA-binding protein